MLEWLYKNKEWVFSGAGVTIVTLLIVFGRKLFAAGRSGKLPVRVQAAIIDMGLGGQVAALSITVSNTTAQTAYLGNIFLRLRNGRQFLPLNDDVTGHGQQQRPLARGQSTNFHITAARIRSSGIPIQQFDSAGVRDALGRVHRSSGRELRAVLAAVLS